MLPQWSAAPPARMVRCATDRTMLTAATAAAEQPAVHVAIQVITCTDEQQHSSIQISKALYIYDT